MLHQLKELIEILKTKRTNTCLDRETYNADGDYICNIEYFYRSTVVTIREFIEFGTTEVKFSLIQEFGEVITDDLFIEYRDTPDSYIHLTLAMKNINDSVMEDMILLDEVQFSLTHGRIGFSQSSIYYIPIILNSLNKKESSPKE